MYLKVAMNGKVFFMPWWSLMGANIWFSTLVTLATKPIPNRAAAMRGQTVKTGDLKTSYVECRTHTRLSSTHGGHRDLAVEEPKTWLPSGIIYAWSFIAAPCTLMHPPQGSSLALWRGFEWHSTPGCRCVLLHYILSPFLAWNKWEIS